MGGVRIARLSYKTFTWPQNPHTYRDERVREPRYRTENGGTSFAGLSPVKRKITGTGAFFGAGAYDSFLKLAALMQDVQPGTLTHSVWGECYCYFTALELTQEPRDDYVRYQFTFTGALGDGEIPS